MDDSPRGSIRAVGAVLHDDQGRLLLVKRAHEPDAGLWTIPGGKVEPGETDEQALVRELLEETGLEVTLRAHVGSVTRGRYDIHDYACEVVGGTLTPGDDAADARWADLADLTSLNATNRLLDALFVTLSDWGVLPRS
ncbi:NUDIX domain-containing protein [Amycolatopsis samaneae]|uniref:NUDIX domain-containing protein n=1 Tax=Amycolatopsis samaneae TaxID=664691 RepID=A0ABW5GKU5_9PSEU